ncbi:MAG TPA: hybrid sensor histidine kinase/response regulator [Vicinamibacterales bacterium]|jgi:signal transduction histidine kinase/CheY-like chemotaxis protein|nr:hybrid sensor histidine kinase/response regulator [Vicinamibacterales bacterium]
MGDPRGTQAGPYPFEGLSPILRHSIPVVATVLVFTGARATGFIDDGGLFLLLSLTVLASAWFAGTGSALLVTVLGAVIGAVVSERTVTPAVEMHLAVFVVQGTLLTALVAELRRSWRAAERQANVASAALKEAEAAGRTKDEFLATISHELRTPLNAVLGWVYLIRTGKLDAGTQARGFESIERNVRMQAQLTSDLLDISKSLTGKLRVESEPVSLRDTVGEAVLQVSPAALAKDLRLNIEKPDGPVVVRGDANRLRQVVWHLMANAIKFTPRGGVIDVTLEANSHARLTVRDTGPGIKPEFLPRIFDRFTQADPSPTRLEGGLGVGLSLVRELVERHGGEISARNNDAAPGAQFTIRLPLHAHDQQSRVTVPPPAFAVASPSLTGVRVLLLDRDRDARELFSVALGQRGAAVRVVDSVDEALEILESWRPDVLVSDATSPERDTYHIVGKVHSLESDRGGRIPALALTAFARSDEQTRQLLSDAHRNLPKPVEPAILTAEIARVAGRERRRQARH